MAMRDPNDLTVTQYLTLRAISDGEFGRPQTAVRFRLLRLAKLGLIERGDRHWRLTNDGWKTLAMINFAVAQASE